MALKSNNVFYCKSNPDVSQLAVASTNALIHVCLLQ